MLLHTKDTISKMAVNSNAILQLKFQIFARNKQRNIPLSSAVYYFAEEKPGRLSTNFIESHASPCI